MNLNYSISWSDSRKHICIYKRDVQTRIVTKQENKKTVKSHTKSLVILHQWSTHWCDITHDFSVKSHMIQPFSYFLN